MTNNSACKSSRSIQSNTNMQESCFSKGSQPISLPPPAYEAQGNVDFTTASMTVGDKPGFDDMIEQLIIRSDPAVRPSREAEASRLRKFMEFTLIKDYNCQRAHPVALTAGDMEHFTTLASILRLTKATRARSEIAPEGMKATEPYMRQCLFEPCIALGVRPEAVWLALDRFFSHTCFYHNKSPGSQMQELFEEGPGKLACKLYVDRTVMIPRLAESAQLMREMFDGLDRVSGRYFDGRIELEVSSLATEAGYMLNLSYKLSQFGERQQEYNEEINKSNHADMSPQHWLARFKHFFQKEPAHPDSPA